MNVWCSCSEILRAAIFDYTGSPKSHCAKVWAYCSAPSYPICKNFSGMFQKINPFEEYTTRTFSEIGVHFFE